MRKDTANLTIENGVKKFRSIDYNYNFRLSDGFFQRWGTTPDDDPEVAPAPEIADVEISVGSGCPISCKMCYKGNMKGGTPRNMSLETFKKLIDKLPKFNGIHFTTQIAYGITSVGTHPEIWDIFQYARDNTIIPNVTINGSDPMTDDQIKKLVGVCGACAISVVPPHFDEAYDLIKKITDAGMVQCNIHFVVSKETIADAYRVCGDVKNDDRLKNLNAIVFLGIKPKERGQRFSVLSNDDYSKLVDYCLDNKVPFGMDSCSVPKFQNSITDSSSLTDDRKTQIMMSVDRCESSFQSCYMDVDGIYWHCSFGEGREDGAGIDVLKANDFLKDVWHHPKLEKWRNKMRETKRECGFYEELHLKNG